MSNKMIPLFCIFGILVFGGVTLVYQPDTSREQKMADAREVAMQWLELADAGRAEACWEQMAPTFQRRVPLIQWKETLANAREPYGNVVERRKEKSIYKTKLDDTLPEGEYVIFQFRTKFEKGGALETVTPMLVDGEWKVCFYFNKPMNVNFKTPPLEN